MDTEQIDSLLKNIGLYKIETLIVNQTQAQLFDEIKRLAAETEPGFLGISSSVHKLTVRSESSDEIDILRRFGSGKNRQNIVLQVKSISKMRNSTEIEIHSRVQYNVFFSIIFLVIPMLIFLYFSDVFISVERYIVIAFSFIVFGISHWVATSRVNTAMQEFIALIQ